MFIYEEKQFQQAQSYFSILSSFQSIIGVALEDLYKELLESEGWEIDDSKYDIKGYFATKHWVTIQFFSWEISLKFGFIKHKKDAQ